MISHHLTNKVKTVKGFNRFSKFLVIGNNIDGFVNIKQVEFKNWEDFKQRFPDIYQKINFAGEWSLKIYQVPDDYKIKYMYEYYKVPYKGKMIADIGYMQMAGKQLDVFISNGMIHFSSRSTDTTENWGKDKEDFEDTDIYEDFLTVILKEDIDNKTYSNDDYPGDAGAVHHERYTKVY